MKTQAGAGQVCREPVGLRVKRTHTDLDPSVDAPGPPAKGSAAAARPPVSKQGHTHDKPSVCMSPNVYCCDNVKTTVTTYRFATGVWTQRVLMVSFNLVSSHNQNSACLLACIVY